MVITMKKLLSIYAFAILFFSCDEDKARTELTLRVKENKISCSGYMGQTECYLIQQGSKIGSEEWDYFYEQIQGFIYEPGYVYELLVAKESVKDPMIDAPVVKYSLLKEISKEPK